MRMRNKPWAIPELKENKLIFFDPVDKKGTWQEEFGNNNPIHLEIGAGWGKFSLTKAANNKDINYVAMEMESNVFVYAGRDFLASKLTNIRGIRGLAQQLDQFFDQGEIEKIYLNFSNPWPANRHKKRRLTHPRQLETYKKILKESGIIELKSDDRDFFNESIDYLKESGFEILEIDNNLPFDKPGNIVTEYEAKWRKMGKPINFLKARLK